MSDRPLPAFEDLTADELELAQSTIGVTAALELLGSLGVRMNASEIIRTATQRRRINHIAGVARFRTEDLYTIAMQITYERQMAGQAE